MKIKFLLVSAFAIVMGLGGWTISKATNYYNAYEQAVKDIKNECPECYVELDLNV